jgi:hypothetical protein
MGSNETREIGLLVRWITRYDRRLLQTDHELCSIRRLGVDKGYAQLASIRIELIDSEWFA